jgi:hypothetical protein
VIKKKISTFKNANYPLAQRKKGKEKEGKEGREGGRKGGRKKSSCVFFFVQYSIVLWETGWQY